MEGFSIATGIITLIDATHRVISICQNYKAAVKGADWELPRIIEEVESLRGVLQGLERLAQLAENGDPAAVDQLPHLSRLCDPKTGTFALCLSELQILERKLTPPGWTGESESKLRSMIQALGWPLKKAFVKETLGNLERFKASLNLDLVTIGLEGTVSVQKTANATQEEVLRVAKTANDLNASLRSLRKDDDAAKALRWLSVLDPSIKYNKIIRDRNAKTGKWLLEYEAFSKWKQTPASFLWLFGIAGCGKTFLSSTVIEHILNRSSSDNTLMVAYFYIDFSEEGTQIPENMIRSLLKQIYCQSHGAVQEISSLYSDCANGTQQPTLDQLLSVSHGVLKSMKDRDTFFIIDALDECNEREKLLSLLSRIYEEKHPKLHILVTSRQELDIEESLEAMTDDEARICIQSELVQEDVLTYIQDRLESDSSLKRFKRQPKIQAKIRETLIEKADGMFRWVACQLDSFKNCLNPTSLEKALKSLPKTLDKTYERILCGVDENYCDYARKILYWLTYSARTLSLVEVAEIVAMDARKEPRFNPENRFFDSREILLMCSSLVSVFIEELTTVSKWTADKEEDVLCIKLAHFSVKEYLISVDIRNGPAKMYAISREIANTSIAESCLALLLHFNKPDSLKSQLEEDGALTSQSRGIDHSLEGLARKSPLYQQFESKYPLAQYAAENWIEHVSNASGDDDFIGGLVLELLLKRDSLENWIRLHDFEELWGDEPYLSKSSRDIGPSIYYASEAGLLKTLEILIETGADVNAPGGEYGNALQVASYNGHEKIIHLLLDKGADINAPGGNYGNALQAASYKGHQEIMHLLLDKGADVNASGGEYGSALQAACSYFGSPQRVKMLLDAGADVNAQGGEYGSALQAASLDGYPQIVQILLDAGADVNAQGGVYGSALQAASSKEYPQIVQILLDAGADVNAQGGEYGNALQAASYFRYRPIVEILLHAGADVNAQGGKYGNALQAALGESRQDVAQILRDHGAHEYVKSTENDEDIESLKSDEYWGSLASDEDVDSMEIDEDVDSMEIDESKEEREGLQSDSNSILPAAAPLAMQ